MGKTVEHTLAIRAVTAVEVAATAAVRFREQYSDWVNEDRFADGKTKGDVLAIFNSQQHTPENVAAALNNGWAYPQCSCCGQYRSVAVEIGRPWGDESFILCADCISSANTILGQFADALKPIPDSAS